MKCKNIVPKASVIFVRDIVFYYKKIIHAKSLRFEGPTSLSRKLILLSFIIPLGLSVYSQSYKIDDYDGQTINTCSGVFYDSGGDGAFANYSDDEDYVVTFCSGNGNAINFNFLSFNVRFGDTLYVFDGPAITSSLIGKYSGAVIPTKLNSSGTCLTFRFISDPSFVRLGWEATITCCPPPVTSPIVPSESDVCSGSTINYSVADHAGSTYNWTVINGTPSSITGGPNNLDITWDMTGDITGSVKVIEVNSCGSKDSSELIVDIYSLPSVDFTGLDAFYCIYSPPVSLTGIPSGGIFTGPGISGNTFTPSAAGPGLHSINYDYIDPATGCSNFKTYQTLVDVPAVFDLGASATSYCAGSGVNITLSGSEPGVNYQLKVNGIDDGPALPGTGSPLTWINKTNGVYTAVAVSPGSSCVSNMTGSQTIIENPLPVPSFTAQPGATSCSNTDVVYATQPGQFNYIWVIPGVAGTDYSISTGGGPSDNSVTLSWLSAGSKIVTINYSDANGCTAVTATSSTPTIVSITPPVPVGSPVQNFCAETSPTVADLIVTGSGILWYAASSGGSPLLTSTPLTNGTHYYASQTVSACESLGRFDVTASVSAIPAAPTANAGSGATCSQITANWAASPLAVSYRLDVSTVAAFTSYVTGYQDLDVGNTTNRNVTGLTAGTTYYYRVRAVSNCGTSANSATITYSTLPATPAVPGPITGIAVQCPGVTGQIYSIAPVLNATTYFWTVPPGWTITAGQGSRSITVSTGTPGQNGNITVTAGNTCGTSAPNSLAVTVTQNASITSVTGTTPLCIGGTSLYTTNGVILGGGTGNWSSSNPAIASVDAAGLVTGISVGTCDIRYTITGGCGGTVFAQQPLVIRPNASISSVTGTSPLCIGGSSAYIANGVVLSGGTGSWSSSNPAIASVNTAGLVTGVSAGTCNIIYTITGGCGGDIYTQQPVIISPNASIVSVTGISPLCIGGSANYTANGVVLSGGTGAWSSSNTAVATVSGTGVVTGVSAGICNIIYTITGGCGGTVSAQQPVTISPNASIASVTGNSPLCIGGSANYTANGVVLSGGTGAWSSSNTAIATVSGTGVVTGVSAGICNIIYTITGGCGGIVSAQQPVTISPNSSIASVTGTSPLCIGSTTTYIANGVILSGGTGAWSSSNPAIASVDATGIVTGVSAGTCNIIYTITGGCGGVATASGSITVTDLPTATISYAGTPWCSNEGVQNVTFTGTVGGTYTADPAGLSINSVTGDISPGTSTPGTYTVTYTIVSAECGIVIATTSVTVNQVPTVIITDPEAVCFPATVDITVPSVTAGSTSGLTYTFWTDAAGTIVYGTPATASAGVYYIKGTDASGCYDIKPVTVTVNPLPTITSIQTNVLCYGESNGTIDITASGGTVPYTYAWTGSGVVDTDEDQTGLAAGLYSVIVTDANSCASATLQVTLTEPSALSGNITSQTDVSVFGGNDGSVTVDGSGGTSPYLYRLDAGAYQPSGTFGGLSAGTYTVTVQDNNLCTFDVPVTITEPPEVLSGSITDQTDIECFGAATGSVTIVGQGGVTPYEYALDGGIYQSSGSFGSLSAGSYIVTIRDAGLSTFDVPVLITQPAELTGTTAVVNVSCYGEATGSIDLTVTGGTGPYSYLWSNGAVTEDLVDVIAGTYSVIITDDNSCIANSATVVSEPAEALSGTTVVTHVLCSGGATGAVDLTVTGGTAPFVYLWSNGATTEDLTNVVAGTYTVIITDANGCTANSEGIVSEFSGVVTVTDVLCYGGATGSIDLTVIGGMAPYTFLWSDGATTEDLTDLLAGDYNVIITDAASCSISASYTVSEPAAALDGTTSVTDVLCFGDATGSVDLSVTGGTAPYTFLWDNGTATEDLTNVVAGDYTITVTDDNGCTFIASVTINQPPEALTGSIASQNNITCYGSSDGSVTVDGAGGITPYLYSLNGGVSQASGTFTGLGNGNHTVTVMDANLCAVAVPVTIAEPAALSIAYTKNDVSCPGESDGSINITITGGTQPYNAIWSDGNNTEDLSDIPDGTYSLVVTDLNGCASSLDVVVDVIGSESCIEIPQVITPNNDGYNDTWIIKNIDLFPNAEVFVFSRWGKLVYQTKNISANPWDGTLNGQLLPTDSYHYILHLNDGSEARSGAISIIR